MSEQDGYSNIEDEIPKIFPGFVELQKEASGRIFESLRPFIARGDIKTIIDLGCGTGEILIELGNEIQKAIGQGSLKDPMPALIGIDSSAGEIATANKKLADNAGLEGKIEFYDCGKEQLFIDVLVGTQGLPERGSLATTAVICVSHTIFHLPYLQLFERLRDNSAERPQVWLVDVYHSWDRVLKQLIDKPGEEVVEPRTIRSKEDGTRVLDVLFTRNDANNPPRGADNPGGVIRGLHELRFDGTAGLPEISISTSQIAFNSLEMEREFSNCGYILDRKLNSHTGWGEMQTFVFSRPRSRVSVADLFLDSHQGKQTASVKDFLADTPPHSPSGMIFDWIQKARVAPADSLGQQNAAFDFFLVEFVPWFATPEGRRQLQQEIILCSEKEVFGFDLEGALVRYNNLATSLQTANVGLFLHPYFTGERGPGGWGQATISHSDRLRTEELLLTEEKVWLDPKKDAILTAIPEIDKNNAPDKFVVCRNFGEINAAYLRESIAGLTRPDVERNGQVADRIIRDHGGLSNETCEKDYAWSSDLAHSCLRHAWGLDHRPDTPLRTIFLSAPLRLGFEDLAVAGTEDNSVPWTYRGGVWIFAGTRQQYGSGHQARLRDLLRVCLLAGTTSVERGASESLVEGIKRHGIRTAAAAIMGRNMSHNIGSHVLARYSSKIGSDLAPAGKDKPDHRGDFLTYLQRRMDFLAEVATSDQAFWSESLSLKEQINRLNYEAQKERFKPNNPILLSYIAGKESLKATVRWGQPPAGDVGLADAPGQSHEIADDGDWIACPGGEVGIHALFVILENVIRNSARHSYRDVAAKEPVEIFVNVQDAGESELLKLEIIDPRAKLNKDSDKEDPENRLDTKINKILGRTLLKPDGTPDPENWGIREMQICAHYLRMLSFSDLKKDNKNSDLAKDRHEVPVLEAGIYRDECLKYTIYLERAKLMAAVVRSGIFDERSKSEKLRLLRKGVCVVELPEDETPDWNEIAEKARGYCFLVVEKDAFALPQHGTPQRVSLPVRSFEFSRAKIIKAFECEPAWIESLHRKWATNCQNKRPAWEDKSLWGVALSEDDGETFKYADSSLRKSPVGLSGGLFILEKGGDRSPIVPLPNLKDVSDWHQTIQQNKKTGHPKATAIAATWIDHSNMQDFNTQINDARAKSENNIETMWISAEQALSDSPHSAYLKACEAEGGWEILAAAVSRVAVLDERVQIEFDKKMRGGLQLKDAWPSMGVWVPPLMKESGIACCNLELPIFSECQKFLGKPAYKDEQFPIDILIIHLTVLEGLARAQGKTLQDTLGDLVVGTQAKDAEIVIVSGRGVPAIKIDTVRYLPISALLESLVTRPSKLALMRALWSAGRPLNVNNAISGEG